ncbi:unnamed protein product [Cunninghamella blakesleeana]
MALARISVLLVSIFLITKVINFSWQQHIDTKTSLYLKRDTIENNKCENIFQQENQCEYVLEYCQDNTPGIINYLQIYYCSSSVEKPIVFILMCVWLLFLFGFVGIAASDFFCPNLQTIASVLNLSESLTGVTFLAFGNGSPDLFSTFSAINSNMGSLALGELIGAAAFIVSVVAGSMCAIKPFRAKRHSFLRDVTFFTLAILLVLGIVSDGLIHSYEAILLIVFYIIYVIFVVGGNYFMKRRSNYLNLISRARLEYGESGTDVDDLLLGNSLDESDRLSDELELYDEGFETEGNPAHKKLHIRTSLFSAIEFQDVVKSLQHSTNGRSFQRQRHQLGQHIHPSTNDGGDDQQQELPLMSRTNSNNHFRTSQVEINEIGLTELPPTSFLSRGFKHIKLNISSSWIDMDEVVARLFPSLYNFDQKSIFNKISSVISAPVIFLLTITLPVVKDIDEYDNNSKNDQGVLNDDTIGILQNLPDDDQDNLQMDPLSENNNKNNVSWCRWLTAIHLIGSPFLFALVLAMNDVLSPIILLPTIILIGSFISILFLLTTSQDHQPRLYWMMSFMGFGMAVIWIYIIANEVVSVLQTVGMALGVSEAILGLTIFAMGNSLGDFVANITIARMGFPLMAMSACFGGPMLNIMLGIGIAATYVTIQRQEPYKIDVSSTIIVSSISLLIVLISSLVIIPLNGYRMSRVLGYLWISIYIVTMIINLIIELRS